MYNIYKDKLAEYINYTSSTTGSTSNNTITNTNVRPKKSCIKHALYSITLI